MTQLDSEEWKQLRHAYGTADDIPDLLRAVYANPYTKRGTSMEDVWFRLWSSLCHQGDVYDASIAAVPHFVEAALRASGGEITHDLITLPVSIEESRMECPHQIKPSDIGGDYWAAILNLEVVCKEISPEPEDKNLREAMRMAEKLLVGRPGKRLPPQKAEGELGDLFRAASNRAEQGAAPNP